MILFSLGFTIRFTFYLSTILVFNSSTTPELLP